MTSYLIVFHSETPIKSKEKILCLFNTSGSGYSTAAYISDNVFIVQTAKNTFEIADEIKIHLTEIERLIVTNISKSGSSFRYFNQDFLDWAQRNNIF